VAVIVGKLGHSIVERNKLRRRLRELTRVEIIPRITGTDLVIRALSTAYNASFAELKGEMEKLGARLSVKES
jgi:ribonuclease P protein component